MSFYVPALVITSITILPTCSIHVIPYSILFITCFLIYLSLQVQNTMQKSVIGRGRGGANRGLGRGGRGATRGKSANNKPANVPLKETEFLAPLFHDKERGRVRNMKATPKDVNFDAGKIVGRPHGNWQGQYSLVTVPDGRPREVAAKNHFTPLISVVDGSANMIIFLVMAYDKPTDATTMKETSSGDHMQMLLDKSRNSEYC